MGRCAELGAELRLCGTSRIEPKRAREGRSTRGPQWSHRAAPQQRGATVPHLQVGKWRHLPRNEAATCRARCRLGFALPSPCSPKKAAPIPRRPGAQRALMGAGRSGLVPALHFHSSEADRMSEFLYRFGWRWFALPVEEGGKGEGKYFCLISPLHSCCWRCTLFMRPSHPNARLGVLLRRAVQNSAAGSIINSPSGRPGCRLPFGGLRRPPAAHAPTAHNPLPALPYLHPAAALPPSLPQPGLGTRRSQPWRGRRALSAPAGLFLAR